MIYSNTSNDNTKPVCFHISAPSNAFRSLAFIQPDRRDLIREYKWIESMSEEYRAARKERSAVWWRKIIPMTANTKAR